MGICQQSFGNQARLCRHRDWEFVKISGHIELRSVSFDHQRTPIFRDLSLTVGGGEKWAIIGPSGCGKTTLLSLVCGLAKPKTGQVLVNGELLVKPRRSTGLILQEYGLLPWATVEQNILLGLQVQQFYAGNRFAKPSQLATPQYTFWIEKLGLQDLQQKYPHQLSGGQKQRTAIARALVLQPDILLLDEPFSALDAPTRESLLQQISAYNSEHNTTLLFVTHSLTEALDLCDRALVFVDAPNNHFERVDLAADDEHAREATLLRLRQLMQTLHTEAV